jgi:aldose 1-epimerase
VSYATTTGEADGLETIQLKGPEVEASFAPRANFVLHSLTQNGSERLAQKHGLREYAERGATMGVPLLHPWANRLAGYGYEAAGKRVQLDHDSRLFARDPGGLPIHGALPGLLSWEVLAAGANNSFAAVQARLDWDRASPAFELFPFAHRLGYEARLSGTTIQITVALEPTSDDPVPVSFGFHPYLLLPGGSREDAEITLPVRRRLLLDEAMIPTGETEPFEPGARPLRDTTWDDGFANPITPTRFVASDGSSELSLTFVSGYSFAQVYAPPGSDFICFEPMTAPTNALGEGGPNLSVASPGETYRAVFELGVSSRPRS